MFRKKAIIMYKLSKSISDENDPTYQEAAKAFYRSREYYLEKIRLLELGVSGCEYDQLRQEEKEVNSQRSLEL